MKELINRELADTAVHGMSREEFLQKSTVDHTLEDIVAWLIVNSLRSEQTQWTMLCIQNISNLYRKNAFKHLLANAQQLVETPAATNNATTAATATTASTTAAVAAEEGRVEELPDALHVAVDTTVGDAAAKKEDITVDTTTKDEIKSDDTAVITSVKALELFDEEIDFSLEASVPDPVPFEQRLRTLMDAHEAFLRPEQHAIGHGIMVLVGQFSTMDSSANRLDTEQEREQVYSPYLTLYLHII